MLVWRDRNTRTCTLKLFLLLPLPFPEDSPYHVGPGVAAEQQEARPVHGNRKCRWNHQGADT